MADFLRWGCSRRAASRPERSGAGSDDLRMMVISSVSGWSEPSITRFTDFQRKVSSLTRVITCTAEARPPSGSVNRLRIDHWSPERLQDSSPNPPRES